LAGELGPQELDERLGQRVRSVGQRHVEQARGLEEALEVLVRAEDEELLLLRVPVRAESGEHAGAVVERVSQNADLRLFVRNDAAVKERMPGQSHGCLPFFSLKSTFQIQFEICSNWTSRWTRTGIESIAASPPSGLASRSDGDPRRLRESARFLGGGVRPRLPE